MKDVMKKLPLERVIVTAVKDTDGIVVDTTTKTEKREYLVIMNINVLEQLDEKYRTEELDGLTAWANKSEKGDKKEQYNILSDFLCMCINEGIRIENKGRKQYGLEELKKFEPDEVNFDLLSLTELTDSIISTSTETKN